MPGQGSGGMAGLDQRRAPAGCDACLHGDVALTRARRGARPGLRLAGRGTLQSLHGRPHAYMLLLLLLLSWRFVFLTQGMERINQGPLTVEPKGQLTLSQTYCCCCHGLSTRGVGGPSVYTTMLGPNQTSC